VYGVAALAVREQGPLVLVAYEGLFIGVHLVLAAISVALMRESPSHLAMVPLHRFIYEPLRIYLLYKSVLNAIRGTQLGWNKLHRTGSVRVALPRGSRRPVPAHRA
jgi:hypothetical protein